MCRKMIANDKKYKIDFAPLQGYTDDIYRNTHNEYFGGISRYYTPFVRLDKHDVFRKKDLRDIEPSNNTACVIPQLIASKPDEFRKIVDLFVEKEYTAIDINMGCPYPPVAHQRKGAGILPYATDVITLLETINEYPSVRFSVKMRLGWDKPTDVFAFLPALNSLPFTQVTVHARVGRQQYKGESDWETFLQFYEQCTHPLFYNGDILTGQDIDRVLSLASGLKGVAIGRGLLANPLLAAEYTVGTKLSLSEKRNLYCRFHESLFRQYKDRLNDDHQLLVKMKTIWEYFLPGTDRKLRKRIFKSSKISDYEQRVSELFNNSEEL